MKNKISFLFIILVFIAFSKTSYAKYPSNWKEFTLSIKCDFNDFGRAKIKKNEFLIPMSVQFLFGVRNDNVKRTHSYDINDINGQSLWSSATHGKKTKWSHKGDYKIKGKNKTLIFSFLYFKSTKKINLVYRGDYFNSGDIWGNCIDTTNEIITAKSTKNIKSTNSSNNNYNESSQYAYLNNNELCDEAVLDGEWQTRSDYLPFVKEAKRRGLGCNVTKSYSRSNTTSLYKFSDWRVCDEVKLGKQEWLEEAKRRRLNCGVNAAEGEKKKQAQLRKIAAEAQKKEKARQERIKAEQEKIKKKEAEEARKKKLADEKARKIAEEKAKKREKEKKKLNKIIANYKLKAKDFYNDVTEFVKSGGEIDVIKLTSLFSNRPKINEKWTKTHIKNFEKLLSFMSNNQAFTSFENKKKENRLAKANADKENTLSSLNDNLKQLNTLLRDNFGNDNLVTNISSNIKLISNILDKKFSQKESDKVLNSTSKFLSDYFTKKKQLKILDSELNDKRVELLEISKKEFGSERGDEATRIIHSIDISNSISEKELILKELEVFLESPIKKQARLDKIEAKKREEEKRRKEAEKKKIAIQKKKEKEEEKEKEQRRLLGPCYEVSGGWGKTKCLALVDRFPLKFVCVDMVRYPFGQTTYDGTIEINIKSHNKIEGKSNVFSGADIIKDKLLTNGILTFKKNDLLAKIKIGFLAIEYEQEFSGQFVHSGYCKERL